MRPEKNTGTKEEAQVTPVAPLAIVQSEKEITLRRMLQEQENIPLRRVVSKEEAARIIHEPYKRKFSLPDECHYGEAAQYAYCWVDEHPRTLSEYKDDGWQFCTPSKTPWLPSHLFDEMGTISKDGTMRHYLHFQDKAYNLQKKELESRKWEQRKQSTKDAIENDDRFIKTVNDSVGFDPIEVGFDGRTRAAGGDFDTDFTTEGSSGD